MRAVQFTPLSAGGYQTNPDKSPTTSALGGSLNILRIQMNELAADINAMQTKLDVILSFQQKLDLILAQTKPAPTMRSTHGAQILPASGALSTHGARIAPFARAGSLRA